MARMMLVAAWCLGIGLIQPAGVVDRLVGDWHVTVFVIGPGFGGGTFPTAGAPATVVQRTGNAATFTEALPTGYARNGPPPKEPFEFAVACPTPDACTLSVKSAEWLQLRDFPLVVQSDSTLAGKGILVVDSDSLPLTASIAFVRPAGHTWEITAMGRDGKPRYKLDLTFKPIGAP